MRNFFLTQNMQNQLFFVLLSVLGATLSLPQKHLGIINGNEVEPHSLPYQASLNFGFPNGETKNCGGSLISENYVLTAAHCGMHFYSFELASNVTVLLGAHKISNSSEETRQTLVSSEITLHPYNILPYDFDIAVIKLPSPVELTDAVQTIPLISREAASGSLVDTDGIVSGWGYIKGSDGPSSDVLLSTEVTVIRSGLCVDGDFNETLSLCVRSPVFGGFCDGDDGSAFMSNGTLIGIASDRVIDCEVKYSPEIYTNVGFYLDWIGDNSDVVIV